MIRWSRGECGNRGYSGDHVGRHGRGIHRGCTNRRLRLIHAVTVVRVALIV